MPPTPAEQVVMHQAYDSQRAGPSVHGIAGELARQQVPTTRGGQWDAGTVRYLLRNALYAEEVAEDVRAITDPEAGGRGCW